MSCKIGGYSSFSNVASLSGGAPVLMPYTPKLGHLPELWVREGNHGRQLPLIVGGDADRFNSIVFNRLKEDGGSGGSGGSDFRLRRVLGLQGVGPRETPTHSNNYR